MAQMSVKTMQTALMRAGFSVGKAGADGFWGRDSIAAMQAFQRSLGLPGGGIPGPKTLAALTAVLSEKSALEVVKAPNAGVGFSTSPVWLEEAKRLMGVRESVGKQHSSTIMGWAKKLGIWYPDDETAWCGLFVAHCIGATLPQEKLPSNPLGARNWLTVGQPLARPARGAILVFWRGSKTGWQGHVGFCVAADPGAGGYFDVLGGNQGNQVSVDKLSKDRLLGIRWPTTSPLPTDFALARATGALSTNEA